MTTCPACGVAVVPGYVKCPRCNTRLPSINFRRAGTTADAGGTAMEQSGAFPWWIPVAAVGAVVVIGVLVIALRRGGPSKEDLPAPPVAVAVSSAPPPAVKLAEAPPPIAVTAAQPAGPNPTAVAEELRHALDKQRLWSTVRVVGTTFDIRSGACADPAMKPALAAAAPNARAAGITKLRCLDESGVVAMTQDL